MRDEMNRFVPLIVDSLNNVTLLAHSGVGKNGIRSSQIFKVRLERADVDRGAMRNAFRNAEVIRDLLHSVQPGELSNAHAHGVARMRSEERRVGKECRCAWGH